MKIILTIFISFIFINLKANDFIKLNDTIDINVCEQYPSNKLYEWKFIDKPINSNLNDRYINKNTCFISFIPDKKGHYEIELKTGEFTKLFNYEVLETLEKSKINISYYTEDGYYYENLNYYKDYDNNNLIFNMNKKIEKVNFNIEGIAIVKDLETNELFIINTNNSNYLKSKHIYQINFFPYKYQAKELLINTDNFNDDINFIPLIQKLNLVVRDSRNKRIIGTTSMYYNEITISRFLSNNLLIDSPYKILFSPIKTINNYPSIIYNYNINSNYFEYDDISFHKLKINLEELNMTEFIIVKIKSIELNKCLKNNTTARCIYQRALILNKAKEILLPDGKYEIKIYKKGFSTIVKTLEFYDNYNLSLNNFLEKNMVKISFPEDTIYISFSDEENNNYHFEINDNIKEIYMPIGKYNITLFTYNGIFNVKLLDINDDTNIIYKWRKININIKENNKIKYGGIILIENNNYIFNSGSEHKFYIEK